MLEQKCKKHWITFTNTYAGTVVLEQSEQFEICSDIPNIDSCKCTANRLFTTVTIHGPWP